MNGVHASPLKHEQPTTNRHSSRAEFDRNQHVLVRQVWVLENDNASQNSTKANMKKLTILSAALLALTGIASADDWNSYDSNGNWSHGHIDRDGTWNGYDSNSNWSHGHIDRDGTWNGYDSNGNWSHGHIDPD
jgi:hypothetical protein